MKVRRTGIDISGPMVKLGSTLAMDGFRRLLQGTLPASTALPSQPGGASIVFESEDGDHYTLLSTKDGPVLSHWIKGSPAEEARGGVPGGFVELPEQDHPSQEENVDPEALEELRQFVERAVTSQRQGATNHRNSPFSGGPGAVPPPALHDSATGGGDAPATSSGAGPDGSADSPGSQQSSAEREGSSGDSVDFTGAGTTAAGSILASLLGSGELNVIGGLMGGLQSLGVGVLTNKLLGSSMGPGAIGAITNPGDLALWVGGPKIAKALALDGAYKPFLEPSPYDALALRQGDTDSAGNTIVSGLPTVQIESAPAAREADPADGKGKPPGESCKFGAKTVLIGGEPAARVHMSGFPGWGTTAGAPFLQSSNSSVFVGGTTTNPDPGVPEEMDKKSEGRFGKGPDGKDRAPASLEVKPWDPEGPPPDGPCRSFDPNAGEWRYWDGKGWSATLSEYSALPGWIPYWSLESSGQYSGTANYVFSLFGVDWFHEQKGNTYLLGGLLDLGSPMFPGAGNTASWWVPDSLFGIDMSPYYTTHDWIFDPANKGHVLDGIYRNLGIELEAFLAGIQSSYCPAHWILQIIYSSATTIAGLLQWWDMFKEEVDGALADLLSGKASKK